MGFNTTVIDIIRRQFTFILFMELLAMFCLLPNFCNALEPEEILVIANGSYCESIDIAQYYMRIRNVPADNLVVVWVNDDETCSRLQYEKEIATPVRTYLEQNDSPSHIRCLVLIYGIPLKVAPSEMTIKEMVQINWLEKRKHELENQLNNTNGKKREPRASIKKELDSIKKKIVRLRKDDKRASLDSEIALVLEKNYPLSGWIVNPYFLGFKGRTFSIKKENVLMVSRLDGPNIKTVKRIIDDSLKTEEKGLSGIAYFDSRWPDPGDKKLSGYAL